MVLNIASLRAVSLWGKTRIWIIGVWRSGGTVGGGVVDPLVALFDPSRIQVAVLKSGREAVVSPGWADAEVR